MAATFQVVGLFLAILIVGHPSVVRAAPQVTLPSSTVLTGIDIPFQESQYLNVDLTIEGFQGIPYAEPPVGDLRFKETVKKADLGSTYAADTYKSVCHQKSVEAVGLMDMDEDCLYLNVYVSSSRPINGPVLVWFHGGAFMSGASSWPVYEPVSLIALAQDIVGVTVNYRLGVLGFLTTGDSASPGNYGMFDQVMALKWIQDNIAAFGGDPDRVTIMGESAGGASVGLHLISPLSEGLFSQGIMESGNALCPWATGTDMKRQTGLTEEIAELVNCTDSWNNEAMMGCLREVDARDLVSAQGQLVLKYLQNELLFVPVIDNNFLPDSPHNLMTQGKFRHLPILLGTNEDEGTLAALRPFPQYVFSKDPPHMSLEMFREQLPLFLYYSTPMTAAAVEQWYVDWTQADNSSANQLWAFIDLNTDQVFACGTEATARFFEGAGMPVYRYEMTHDPSWSVWAGIPGWLGAGHAEELQYVFGWDLNPNLENFAKQTDEEKEMSVQFMRYWTNFIKSGDPNSPLLPGGNFPDWPRYTIPEQEYKILTPDFENGRALRMDACAFWLRYMFVLYDHDPGHAYNDWQKNYAEWKDVSMKEWTEEFEKYKNDDSCPQP